MKKNAIVHFLVIGLALVACMAPKKAVAPSWDAPPEALEGLNPGNRAPALAYKNPKDSLINLSSLKGKIVLIDFWASWCGPCRFENPNLTAAYKKYSNAAFLGGEKGFTVYSVSLDMNKAAWLTAIAKDNLEWPWHVSDLKGWGSEAASKYGVMSIPSSWLIDGRGVILATNLRGAALDNKLESILAPEKKNK